MPSWPGQGRSPGPTSRAGVRKSLFCGIGREDRRDASQDRPVREFRKPPALVPVLYCFSRSLDSPNTNCFRDLRVVIVIVFPKPVHGFSDLKWFSCSMKALFAGGIATLFCKFSRFGSICQYAAYLKRCDLLAFYMHPLYSPAILFFDPTMNFVGKPHEHTLLSLIFVANHSVQITA